MIPKFSNDKLIHTRVYNFAGELKYWCTGIYAWNTLKERKNLWGDIEKIEPNQNEPWIIMGDFNNVLRENDRLGGKVVMEAKYEDLASMMEKMDLYEKDSQGDHFTWSNKKSNRMIFSRIDRIIANIPWHQQHINYTLFIMELEILDHSLLCLKTPGQVHLQKSHFKFLNVVIQTEGFLSTVKEDWDRPMEGSAMLVLWKKLQRLQLTIRRLSQPYKGINVQIYKARNKLYKAQNDLL